MSNMYSVRLLFTITIAVLSLTSGQEGSSGSDCQQCKLPDCNEDACLLRCGEGTSCPDHYATSDRPLHINITTNNYNNNSSSNDTNASCDVIQKENATAMNNNSSNNSSSNTFTFCYKCQVENCHNCSTDNYASGCDSCIPGYELENSSGTKCVEKDKDISTRGPGGSDDDGSDSDYLAMGVGIAVAGVVVLGAAAAIAVILWRRRGSGSPDSNNEEGDMDMSKYKNRKSDGEKSDSSDDRYSKDPTSPGGNHTEVDQLGFAPPPPIAADPANYEPLDPQNREPENNYGALEVEGSVYNNQRVLTMANKGAIAPHQHQKRHAPHSNGQAGDGPNEIYNNDPDQPDQNEEYLDMTQGASNNHAPRTNTAHSPRRPRPQDFEEDDDVYENQLDKAGGAAAAKVAQGSAAGGVLEDDEIYINDEPQENGGGLVEENVYLNEGVEEDNVYGND